MSLRQANQAYRERHFSAAMLAYLEALDSTPGLANVLLANIRRTAEAYQAQFAEGEIRRVGVCGWSLTHNAAGRAFTLAQLHQHSAEVELVGALFPRYGQSVWEPIRDSGIPVDVFKLGSTQDFIGPALRLVAAHPFQLVHLSKPRMPNILFGMLYKLLWNARVIVDIDDDELAFVGGSLAETPDLDSSGLGKLPKPHRLPGLPWTRIAVRIAPLFDAITVSNPTLKDWFGGQIVRHARCEKTFDPDGFDRAALRQAYGLPEQARVVLFLGTPRAHKGLVETAEALERLGQDDLCFLIVGSFGDDERWIVSKLESFKRLHIRFLPNQPFEKVPELVALADVCLALQHPDSQVTIAQVPAKLSDALAMGKPVVATQNRAFSDLDLGDLACLTDLTNLEDQLRRALDAEQQSPEMARRRREKFLAEFSLAVNAQRVQKVVRQLPAADDAALLKFMRVILPHFRGFPRVLLDLRQSQAQELETAGIAERRLAEILAQNCPPGLREALEESQQGLERSAARLQGRPDLPLVSVIMPTWNRAPMLAEAIQSVRDQCYPAWELWVCDDGSTDATMDVVCQFSDSRVHYLPLDHAGAAAARNQGLQRASGQIIAYLDSDNIWRPEFLSRMVDALLEFPGHSCVYGNYLDYRADAAGNIQVRSFERPMFDHERLLDKNYIDLNAFVHRRELYDCFGGFTESLSRRQDYDLIIKYTWLRDPLYVDDIVTLYQRNASLDQLTVTKKHDKSPIKIIGDNIERYLTRGLPLPAQRAVQRVTVLSWDMSRNHFSKAFAVAESLSVDYDVQLISFRFFDEEIFPPLKNARPDFETVYIQGSVFPDFFSAMREALAAISGDVIYVVKPRLPSLGLALLANAASGVPIVLEINDLESVVQSPGSEAMLPALDIDTTDVRQTDLLNPYSTLWSRLMEPLASELPALVTHNCNIDRHFGSQCLYLRNLKDERVYDPALYDREAVRSDLGFGQEDRVILFGGLIRKHKGIYELVELVDRLADPRFKLLFVGSRLSPDQQELVARYGDRLTLLPPQDRAAMARINLAADLVVLWLNPDVPASHYQMPYKATDAFAMGPAVIANDISDLGDLGRQGYLKVVPFGDWDAMVSEIKALFANDGRRRGLSAASRRLFLRQFSYPAGRASFELAARRAIAQPAEPYAVAQDFAAYFNRFYLQHGSRNRDFFTSTGLEETAAVSWQADLARSICVWDGEQSSPVGESVNADEVLVLMPSAQRGPALQMARRLVLRAGCGVKVMLILSEDSTRRAEMLNQALGALSPQQFVVFCGDRLLPGVDWLRCAWEALTPTDAAMLAFNAGHAAANLGPFVMARMQWLHDAGESTPFSQGMEPAETIRRLAGLAQAEGRLACCADAVLLDLSVLAAHLNYDPARDIDPRFRSRPRRRFWKALLERFLHGSPAAAADSVMPDIAGDDHSHVGIQVHEASNLPRLIGSDAERVLIILPAIRPGRALATARLLRERAGLDVSVQVVIDSARQGFVATVNQAVRHSSAEFVVYVAEDAVPGQDWLKIALEALDRSDKGLLAFNCGKWQGRIASFGMVRRRWVSSLYGKDLFYPGYKAHRADNELTVIARANDQFVYCPEALLMENDHRKIRLDAGPQAAHMEDRKLFRQRYEKRFHGLAPSAILTDLRADYLPSSIPKMESIKHE